MARGPRADVQRRIQYVYTQKDQMQTLNARCSALVKSPASEVLAGRVEAIGELGGRRQRSTLTIFAIRESRDQEGDRRHRSRGLGMRRGRDESRHQVERSTKSCSATPPLSQRPRCPPRPPWRADRLRRTASAPGCHCQCAGRRP